MPKPASDEVEVLIQSFSNHKLSSRKIKEKLKVHGFEVSQSTISRVIRNHGIKRYAKHLGVKGPRRRYRPFVRTIPLINQVRLMTSKDNPPSQREMAKLHGVSQTTIKRIIHKDLLMSIYEETEVDLFKPNHDQNPKTTVTKRKKMLDGRKSVIKEEEFLHQIKMKIEPTHWLPYVELENLNKIKDSATPRSNPSLMNGTITENGKKLSEMKSLTGSCTKGKGQLQPNKNKTPSNKQYKCPLCQNDFSSFYKLGFHIHHRHQDVSNPYLCFNCPSSFKNLNDLNKHLIAQHPEDFKAQNRSSDTNRDPNSLCLMSIGKHKGMDCPKAFPSQSALKRHTSVRSKNATGALPKCTHCTQTFNTCFRRNLHEKSHGDTHLCPYCPTGFNVLSSLNRHKFHIHLKSLKDLEIHKGNVHIIKGIDPSGSSRDLPRLLEPTYLPGISNHSVDIGQDPLLVSSTDSRCGRKIYSCDRCGTTFKRATNLRRHRTLNICEGVLARCVECQKCGEFFESQSSFKRHECSFHPNPDHVMIMPVSGLSQYCDVIQDPQRNTDKDETSTYQTVSSKSEEPSRGVVKVEDPNILQYLEIVPTEIFTNTSDPEFIKIESNVDFIVLDNINPYQIDVDYSSLT